MNRKRVLALLALMLVALLMVPTIQAQSTDFDFNDVIRQLGPSSNGGTDLLFDILRYLLFFLAFITMVLVPDKQLLASLLMVFVLGLLIFAKLEIFDPGELPTLGINVGIFVIPMIVAGMLRARVGKTPRALIPAILTGLLGGGYFFLFWALEQRTLGG